jgi:hypothetical protein
VTAYTWLAIIVTILGGLVWLSRASYLRGYTTGEKDADEKWHKKVDDVRDRIDDGTFPGGVSDPGKWG